jgi:hypothetical protein
MAMAIPAAQIIVALIAPDRRWLAWGLAILLALGAITGTLWLRRNITPTLLTPENARSLYQSPSQPPDEPREPGGAPSV